MLEALSFQSPTIFGTIAALSQKVEEMDIAAPPLIDFFPIESKLASFAEET